MIMKKLVCVMMSLCLAFALFIPTVPIFAKENKDPVSIRGKSAIVLDLETGKHLYEKKIHKRRQPASITKIMTALVILEKKQLSDSIKFSQEALNSIEAGSSSAGIRAGEILTVEQSLYVMMLESANDIAHGLAYATAGDMKTFAGWMNEKATQLGCTGTHFENASGLSDPDHYTTASDMAKIANAAYENETLRNIMSTELYELAPTNKCNKKRHWINGNRMLRKGSKYYYAACTGGKTGYTMDAGGTLVTFARIDDRDLACVVLASNNSVGTYRDSTELYEYIRKNGNLDQYNETMVKEDKREVVKTTATQTTKATTEEQGKIIHKEKTSFLSSIPTSLKGIVAILVLALLLCMYLRFKIRRKRAKMKKKKKLNQQKRQQAQRNTSRNMTSSSRNQSVNRNRTSSSNRSTAARRVTSQGGNRVQNRSTSRNTSANRSRMQDRNRDLGRMQRRNSSNYYNDKR